MARTKQEYDVFEEFQEILEYKGDKRTKDAIKLKKIRQGLKESGNQAMTELFVNVISHNLLIEQKLTDSLLEKDALLDEEGNLNPIVSKDLMKLRDNTLKYLKMLQSIKSKGDSGDSINLADFLDE
jgi:hypothetical protein